MPYAPGINYTGDRSIAQGRQNLMEAIMTLVGGLTEQGRQAKELRTTLSEIDPGNKDRFSKMGLSELKGAANAMEMKSKMDASQLLATEMRQRIAAGAKSAQDQAAMEQAMGQAAPGTASASLLPGSPMSSLFSVRTPQAPQAGDLVAAMMRNPGAVNTPAGQSVLGDWLRTQTVPQRGMPEAATVGGVPTIYNRFSGQFEVDPAYKIQAAARAKQEMAAQPGAKPLLSPDEKFFWTGKEWKPVPAKKTSNSLFDTTGGTPAASATPAAGPKMGDRVKQGGVVYEFNGDEWVEAK